MKIGKLLSGIDINARKVRARLGETINLNAKPPWGRRRRRRHVFYRFVRVFYCISIHYLLFFVYFLSVPAIFDTFLSYSLVFSYFHRLHHLNVGPSRVLIGKLPYTLHLQIRCPTPLMHLYIYIYMYVHIYIYVCFFLYPCFYLYLYLCFI